MIALASSPARRRNNGEVRDDEEEGREEPRRVDSLVVPREEPEHRGEEDRSESERESCFVSNPVVRRFLGGVDEDWKQQGSERRVSSMKVEFSSKRRKEEDTNCLRTRQRHRGRYMRLQ